MLGVVSRFQLGFVAPIDGDASFSLRGTLLQKKDLRNTNLEPMSNTWNRLQAHKDAISSSWPYY